MKNKNNSSINIIFTLLFLIMSTLFLIYIFRDTLLIDTSFINNPFKEKFIGNPYSWKFGDGSNYCRGSLDTNIELSKIDSSFRRDNYNRFENAAEYNQNNLRSSSHQYAKYCDVMRYSDLLAYRCLRISPSNLLPILYTADIKNTFDAVFLYNDTSLFSYLVSKIQQQKNMLINEKIIGPVYVCISQAPYLKYKNDKRIGGLEKTFLDARIDILNNRNPFYYEQINSAGVQRFEKYTSDRDDSNRAKTDITDADIIPSSLYCQVLIIYPLYINKEGMTLKKTDPVEQTTLITTFLDTTLTNYYSNNELCNIKCNKSLTLNCGCLSYNPESSYPAQNNTYFDNATTYTQSIDKFDKPTYTSKCINHTTTPNNLNANYSMMYFVNPFSNTYGGDVNGDNNMIKEPRVQ